MRSECGADEAARHRIRPLLGEDLRKRRLSGRLQISTDGRHLVDGLAYGRPWLRAPRDRPPVELPPRKRVRTVCYNPHLGLNADDVDEEYEPRLLLQAPEPGDEGK